MTAMPTPSGREALVLSYAARDAAPTRLRHAASYFMRAWAGWMLALGALLVDIELVVYFYWIMADYYGVDRDYLTNLPYTILNRMWGPPPPSLATVLGDCTRQNWPVLAAAFLCLMCAALFRLPAGGVLRGSRPACFISLALLTPWLVLMGVVAAGSVCVAIIFGTGWFLPDPAYGYLLFLPVAVAAFLPLGGLWRASRRMVWIARNPYADREIRPLWRRRPRAGT